MKNEIKKDLLGDKIFVNSYLGVEEHPKIEYKIRVMSTVIEEVPNILSGGKYSPVSYRYRFYDLTKTIGKFVEDIEPGDIILIEYPPYFEGNWGFKICVTNLRTEKSVLVMAKKLKVFFMCLGEYEPVVS